MSDRKGKAEILALTTHSVDKGYLALIRDSSVVNGRKYSCHVHLMFKVLKTFIPFPLRLRDHRRENRARRQAAGLRSAILWA